MRKLYGLHVSRPRLFLALAVAVGVAATFAIPVRDADAVMRALIGWNVAVYLYLIIIWLMMHRADQQDVCAFAKQQDEKAYVILIMLSLGALMSLSAIVIELAGAGAGDRSFHIAMAAATVVGSWLLLPTVFGLHYAHMYYQVTDGETTLIFPDKSVKPDYWDFMYFAFTIAVAFATSDIAIRSRRMRKMVLAQSVMAFFFNASILALSVNISAGLVAR